MIWSMTEWNSLYNNHSVKDHLAIKLLMAIRLPDMSNNRMPTVFGTLVFRALRFTHLTTSLQAAKSTNRPWHTAVARAKNLDLLRAKVFSNIPAVMEPKRRLSINSCSSSSSLKMVKIKSCLTWTTFNGKMLLQVRSSLSLGFEVMTSSQLAPLWHHNVCTSRESDIVKILNLVSFIKVKLCAQVAHNF